MFTSLCRFAGAATAALVVAGVLASSSQAAPIRYQGPRVLPNSASLVNPNYQLYPGMSINQYSYNMRTLGRAYSSIPPYALGYNPYPAPIINYNSVYPSYVPPAYYNPYYNPYYNNPYLYNSYANPYSSLYP